MNEFALDTSRPSESDTTLEPRPSAAALASTGGRQLWVALRFLVAMTIVTGIVYPLVVLGIGQLVAKHQADGSLISDADGNVVGSSLIGQSFDGDQWFIGRPSAAGEGYDAMSSSGTNLSADSPDLLQSVQNRKAAIAQREGVDPSQVPPDAVTSSASGLDPDISVQYANIQVARVAAARNLPIATVADLVRQHTEGHGLGFIGNPSVNVLELNLALENLKG